MSANVKYFSPDMETAPRSEIEHLQSFRLSQTVRKVYEASLISREEGANEMAKAVTRKQKLNQIRTLEVHLS